MVECAHGNSAPDLVVSRLSECQAGEGRHKCAVCAYAAGHLSAQSEKFAGPIQECDQGHASAPIDMLRSLPDSQAGPHRHRCAYEAFQRGKNAAVLDLLQEDDEIAAAEYDEEQSQAHKVQNDPDLPETERAQLLLARRGQGQFRRAVIEICQVCVLSGLQSPQFTIASHIKPWRSSSHVERLDGYNGLLLSPQIDHLFDKGWITVANNGTVQTSSKLDQRVIEAWGVETLTAKGKLSEKHAPYLEFHRSEIYKP